MRTQAAEKKRRLAEIAPGTREKNRTLRYARPRKVAIGKHKSLDLLKRMSGSRDKAPVSPVEHASQRAAREQSVTAAENKVHAAFDQAIIIPL